MPDGARLSDPLVSETRPLRWVWRGALAFFVLAGLTGVFFRFAVAQGVVFGFDLGNVRHAHSHAMYFGWVTPALMALIALRLPSLGARPMRRAGLVIGIAFAMALLAYPPFLLFGYAPAILGDVRLPLSVMAAGFNVFAWYAFAGLYVRARRGAPPSLALRLFDLALFFLIFATLGAWGLPVLQALDVENHVLKAALTHLFLDVFSEGWFVLGVLGLAAAEVKLSGKRAGWGVRLAAAGVPFTFALGMAPSLVPPAVLRLSSVGGVLLSVGLMLIVAALWRERPRGLWRFALAALGLKALALVAASLVPGAGWAAVPGFRILYLHLGLLGFVSVGLVAAARTTWDGSLTRGRRVFAFTVAVLLVSLVPLTPLWPWRGAWVYSLAALLALGPVLAALYMLIARRLTRRAAPSRRRADERPGAASQRHTDRAVRRRSRQLR